MDTNSPCGKDKKGKHNWKIIGFSDMFIVWRCNKCGYCHNEKAIFI